MRAWRWRMGVGLAGAAIVVAPAALAANGFRQVTSPRGRFRTFPAWLAVGALDKAFVRGPIDVRHARVVRTSLAKTASDHLPVVIDFHLR